jgi:hypothetical protein
MARLRDCAPAPHDLVQGVQAEKALVAQWIGHGPWLQARVSAVCAHAFPPNWAWVTTRLRRCEPAAHEVVHVVQALKVL